MGEGVAGASGRVAARVLALVAAVPLALAAVADEVHAAAEPVTGSISRMTVLATGPVIDPPPEQVATEHVDVSVPAGALVLSIDIPPGAPGSPENPASLGSADLDPAGRCLVTVATLPTITITDDLAGVEAGFTLSVQANTLVKDGVVDPDGTEMIDGQNVGVSPTGLITNLPVSAVSASTLPPADCVLMGTPGAAGAGGAAHVLVSSTQGPGTITFAPRITVKAPPTTRDGTFTGTLVYTLS